MDRDEFDDLRAQVMAQKLLMNAILIALRHKKVFSGGEIEVLIESTLASLDRIQDPIVEAAASYLEDFRIASQSDE